MTGTYQDIPRLYTAIAEWMGCMLFLGIGRRQLSDWMFFVASVVFLAIQSLFLVVTEGTESNVLWILYMVIAVVLMYGFLMLAGNYTPLCVAYICGISFLVAEFMAALEWQLHAWFAATMTMTQTFAWLLLVVVYGATVALVYLLAKPQLTAEFLERLTLREVLSSMVIVLFAFVFSNMSFILSNSPFSGRIMDDIYYMRTLADAGGLAVFYAYQSRISELLAEQEVAAIQQVLRSQYEQYRNYQESEEMLHILQHDLKHQIDGLREETDLTRRKEWLDAMEQELDSWRIPQKSGNPVLDTILAAKIRQARNLKIRMTCVADGELLSMLHVIDICTIFGNALDNAIESVVQIEEEEKRLIHVSVSAQKQFTFIQISNTCETEIRHGEGDTLLTTKADQKKHGYGLKSIRYSVEKYGGSVSVEVRQEWFELRILIPRNEKQTK